jgi:predicted alpha/beta superfamily hydrolase
LDPNRLRKHIGFRSRFLPTARDFIVYLPEIYNKDEHARFPVLFLQDGQNLFDPGTSFVPGMHWQVGETADALIAEGSIRPLVIVGIYNTGKKRVQEYTPSRDRKRVGGGADKYGRMLLEEIKPLIELEYRVLTGPAHTGIGGSSLGGLLALYLGLRHAEIFGRMAVLSPSVWWNQRWILGFVSRVQISSRPRLWLDAGTQESPRELPDVQRLRDALLAQGWEYGRDLHYDEIPGGQHNEASWAARVGPFLQFLFPAGEGGV